MEEEQVDSKKLFVSNFTDRVDDSILYELFLQAGPIDNVMIESAADNSLVGIIEYKHRPSVSYAKNIFDGTRLFGKLLNLSFDNLLDSAESRAREARQRMLQHCQISDPRPRHERMDIRNPDRRDRNDWSRNRDRDRYHPYDRHRDRRDERGSTRNYGMNNRNQSWRDDRRRRY